MTRKNIIPVRRRRLAGLIARRNHGLLTPGEEAELRDLVASEGFPAARSAGLETVVDLGLGIMFADIVLGEA